MNKFDFQHPHGMELRVRDSLDLEWMEFLTSIDTANIVVGELDPVFVKKHSGQKGGNVRSLIFSPVIFSRSGDKAVCGTLKFSSKGGLSEHIVLLERNGKKWMIRKRYFISVS
ncbi:hypothetical protein [Mucilaginibacter myungsuensis]|uniref:Uncharacterized protein n=1 Tax=Mucilaginibacter myungsuensis TaxID=649104 RepID=A0A929PUX3_9SPHI|nr:hypothetical protein [Mucilaginibacter myungsuensis]MBE9661218.1 hypothetical protein [Mucilaginibacter myungsuensis]MDN3597362.1 hypothetical protein [Mucilaginibacter myungsuensis]